MKTISIRWFWYLPFFIVFLLILGCSGEEVEAPLPESDTRQVAVTEFAQTSDTSEVGEAHEEGVKVEPTDSVNTPPEIVAVKLKPRLVYPGTLVKAEVEIKDNDSDGVAFDFEWKRNDDTLSGQDLDELDTAGFKKGDFITVTVTPSDGKKKGRARRSLPLIIANRPPEITSFPPSDVSDGKYLYEVKAMDSDGDSLTFSFEASPPGMTINPSTGFIEWNIPHESNDIFQVRIVVTDGDASAFQGFSMNLKRE